MYEEEARLSKARLEELHEQHERLNSTKYTNELLEENNDVMKATLENTGWIFNVLIVIAVMLSFITFTVVFQIEPWWK